MESWLSCHIPFLLLLLIVGSVDSMSSSIDGCTGMVVELYTLLQVRNFLGGQPMKPAIGCFNHCCLACCTVGLLGLPKGNQLSAIPALSEGLEASKTSTSDGWFSVEWIYICVYLHVLSNTGTCFAVEHTVLSLVSNWNGRLRNLFFNDLMLQKPHHWWHGGFYQQRCPFQSSTTLNLPFRGIPP